MVKHLSATHETSVRSLGWEDHLEKEMAAHSTILAWKIPWMKEPGGLQSVGSQRVGHDWATNTHTKFWKFSGIVSSNIFSEQFPLFLRLLMDILISLTDHWGSLRLSTLFSYSDFFLFHNPSTWHMLWLPMKHQFQRGNYFKESDC